MSNAEQTISGVAQSGNDEAPLIELLIDSSCENRQGGVVRSDATNSFGSRHQVHELHPLCTQLGQQIHCRNSAAASAQHGVDEDDLEPTKIRRKALVIEHRSQRGLLAP